MLYKICTITYWVMFTCNYFVKYINDYNIDYVIGQLTDIPECLKFEKVDQFLFKNVRRNFLLKEGITNFNLYKITNKKCK